ncbi:MAG: glycosyl hydrolase [Bacteroidales bacterium]|jgi:hypothetical protein|nr:glycosyl hydrolase [Bacteroidales bacterium]
MKKILIYLLILATVNSIQAQKRTEKGVKANSAEEFLNSIGVVSSISVRGESLEKTIEHINYTGIRWLRTGYEGNIPVTDLIRLHKHTGARIGYGLLSGGNDIPRLLSGARELAKEGALLSIEGPNEPNNWGIKYDNVFGGKDQSWLPVAKLQRDLYDAIKNDPLLKNYPVWSISENGAQTDNVGLQFLTIPDNVHTLMPAGTKYADFANCHNYFCHPSWPGLHDNQTWLSADPSILCPVDGLYGNYGSTWLRKFPGYTENELLNLPRVTTETGMSTDEMVTEEVQGCLYMNMYLSQFKRGWKYTAMYLLRTRSDETNHEGYAFYRLDNTPKKAAIYLHHLTTILEDDTSSKNPGIVDFSIPDQPETVHELLLQKSDGTFMLVVWGERFTGGTDDITIKLDKRYPLINIYDPTEGTAPLSQLKNVNTVKLSMTNHPVILEFK